ncbi:MAG: hypothetical protein IJX19_13140, partial [Clostridia bacterium]|nr:hypothetical protein [Clostridia bacterium]
VGFQTLRSETCTFEGVTIKLGCDMIINKGTAEEIKARGSENHAWKNPAPNHLFKGNIDGQGHTISGVYMQLTDDGNASMFGSVAGTVKMEDFNLTNSYFGAPNAAEDKEVLAGLVTRVTEEGTKLRISKVNLEITIEESGKKFNKAAGFVGCIDGKVDVTIDNSNFNGKIVITGTYAGGFIAHIPGTLSVVRVTTCTNFGEIATAQYCGGMIGQSKSQDMQTLDCFNRGELKCDLNCKNLTGEQIALYDPYEGAHPPIKEGTTGIRVMSFNIQYKLPKENGVLSNATLNRVAAVKNEILYYSPDLLGVQEDQGDWHTLLNLEDYDSIQSSVTGERCAIYYKKGMKLLDSGSHWLTSDGTSESVALTYAEVTDPKSPYYLTDTERMHLQVYNDADLDDAKTKYWDETTGKFVEGEMAYSCGTSRRFTYGVFEVNGQILIYINTHLSPRNQGRDYANDAFDKVRSYSRLKEWDMIMDYLDEIKKKYPDSLAFFTGDFNDHKGMPIYNHVTQTFGYFSAENETPEHIGPLGSWNTACDMNVQGDCYPQNKSKEGKTTDYLDYCFFEKGLTVERLIIGQGRADILDVATGKPKTIYTSDHLPVITDLSFKTETTGTPIVPDHTEPEVDLSKPSIYSGLADTSWYTGDKTEYVLTTAEQFAGFLELRQSSKGSLTFEGVTVKLARDLIFNQGTVEEFLKNNPYQLQALHSNYQFKGTFDGQGHTISGIYLQCTGGGVKGLFGSFGDNAVVKDLTLDHCYAGSANVTGKNTLSILAARISGKNVLFSNVKITNFLMKEDTQNFSRIGALVGRVDSDASITIENCHATNGTLDFATKGSRVGSLIGEVLAGATLTVKGSTSNANISGTDLCGGLVGNTSGTVTFDDQCSYTGTITCPGTKGDLISNP